MYCKGPSKYYIMLWEGRGFGNLLYALYDGQGVFWEPLIKCNRPTFCMTSWLREGRGPIGECNIISGGGSVVLLYKIIWGTRSVKKWTFFVI